MSSNRKKRKNNRSGKAQRRCRVWGVRRHPVDVGKFSQALIGLAIAEVERQAQAEHAARSNATDTPGSTANDAPGQKKGTDDV